MLPGHAKLEGDPGVNLEPIASRLAWKHFGILREELERVPGEKDIRNIVLTLLLLFS